MMTREEVFEQLKEIIVRRLKVKEVWESALLVEDLKADSLDIVEMIMEVEERFRVEVKDEELEKMKTVSDVVEYIYSQLSNR